MPTPPANIAVVSPQTMSWIIRQCHRVAGFNVTGPGVEFHKGDTSMSCHVRDRASRHSGTAIDQFPGVLTAASLATGHTFRWTYTFAEVAFSLDDDGNLTYTVKPVEQGGRAGVAWNLAEVTHEPEPILETPAYVYGVDIHGSTYADSAFGPRPVGGGGTSTTWKLNQVVDLTERRIASAGEAPQATTLYTFDRPGSHDGDCDAPE